MTVGPTQAWRGAECTAPMSPTRSMSDLAAHSLEWGESTDAALVVQTSTTAPVAFRHRGHAGEPSITPPGRHAPGDGSVGNGSWTVSWLPPVLQLVDPPAATLHDHVMVGRAPTMRTSHGHEAQHAPQGGRSGADHECAEAAQVLPRRRWPRRRQSWDHGEPIGPCTSFVGEPGHSSGNQDTHASRVGASWRLGRLAMSQYVAVGHSSDRHHQPVLERGRSASSPPMAHTVVDEAVDAAHEAFASWRAMPVEERAALVASAARLMRQRSEELAQLITSSRWAS